MRLSATVHEHRFYRIYDHVGGCQRHDICWVDDELAQVGVGFCMQDVEITYQVEQRRRVLIIPALKWVSLDLSEESEEHDQRDKETVS